MATTIILVMEVMPMRNDAPADYQAHQPEYDVLRDYWDRLIDYVAALEIENDPLTCL